MCKSKTRALGLLEECVAEIGIAKKMSAEIKQSADFLDGIDGLTHLRAASMSIQYVTECIKQLDNITSGKLLVKYPGVDWKSVKGMRDMLSHAYSQVDENVVFDTLKSDFPVLAENCALILYDVNAEKHDALFISLK